MATHLTAPIYYYDSNGYKIGPIKKRELVALAERRTINPETRITDEKVTITAKNVLKLKSKFCAPEYHRASDWSGRKEKPRRESRCTIP